MVHCQCAPVNTVYALPKQRAKVSVENGQYNPSEVFESSRRVWFVLTICRIAPASIAPVYRFAGNAGCTPAVAAAF